MSYGKLGTPRGILDVELTADRRSDPLFADMPHRQECLQWHSVRVAQPPASATVLASSSACHVQAMRVGSNAWSMQYHVEVEPDTVAKSVSMTAPIWVLLPLSQGFGSSRRSAHGAFELNRSFSSSTYAAGCVGVPRPCHTACEG